MDVISAEFAERPKRRAGLVVLKTDETIEREISQILPIDQNCPLFVTRIYSGEDVTSDTLGQMEIDLPAAATLFPDVDMDVVGYGCTSGATVIGPQRIEELVQSSCKASAVCEPITSVIDAARHLGIKKLAVLTPYVPEVSEKMREHLNRNGLAVTGLASFGIQRDADVARVSGRSIFNGLLEVAKNECDGIFVSCTNLAALDVIPKVEAETGKPVLSSNQALGWAMGRKLGLRPSGQFGRLFQA